MNRSVKAFLRGMASISIHQPSLGYGNGDIKKAVDDNIRSYWDRVGGYLRNNMTDKDKR